MAMLYYLSDLDVFLYNQKDIRYVRFVDDIVIIGKNKTQLLKLMPEIRKIVLNNNCQLNEKKFYFQHYSKGLEFLGSHLKYRRIYLNNKTVYRLLCKIRFLNGIQNKVSYISKFQQCINSYFGMMKRRSEIKMIYRLVFKYINKE
jgi:hypothetical protein